MVFRGLLHPLSSLYCYHRHCSESLSRWPLWQLPLKCGLPVGFLPPAPHAVHHPRKGTGCLNEAPSPRLLWLAPSGHHQGCENHALPHPGPENGHSVASGPGLLAVYLTGKSAPCLGKPDRCRALKIHNSGLFQVSGEAQNRERERETSTPLITSQGWPGRGPLPGQSWRDVGNGRGMVKPLLAKAWALGLPSALSLTPT